MAFWWKRKQDNKKSGDKEPRSKGEAPPKVVSKPSPKPKGKASPSKGSNAGKASSAGKAIPLEVKVLCMEAIDAGLEPKEVAKLAEVSKSSLLNWRTQWRKAGASGLARKSAYKTSRRLAKKLEERIIAHRQEHPEHGVRRIRDELARNDNLSVSAETVRRVVNDAGLGQPPPKPKRRPPQVRRFERSVPNAMWQIDIFTFELKRMYKAYLIGIIDDHSRYIVGHGLFRQQTKAAVMEVVKGAVGQWGAPREILSDNGRQFVAWRGKTDFQRYLRRQGVGHVRSAPHHPMTLGKIERFWKTIWTEYLQDATFASFADATQRLQHWMAYYNHQRPHQGIDSACPADRFYGLRGDIEEAVKQGCRDNSLRLARISHQTSAATFGWAGATSACSLPPTCDVRPVRLGRLRSAHARSTYPSSVSLELW